jgi:hypothetical protein
MQKFSLEVFFTISKIHSVSGIVPFYKFIVSYYVEPLKLPNEMSTVKYQIIKSYILITFYLTTVFIKNLSLMDLHNLCFSI